MNVPRRYWPLMASIAVYVLLYAAASVRYADQVFFSVRVFINFLSDNSFLGIVAVGMTFVIVCGGIDLSVGAVMSLSSVVVGVLIMNAGWPPLPAILAALILGMGLGLGMGCIIEFLDMKPFIVTLAGMFFARGLAFIIHLESIGISDGRHSRIAALGVPLGSLAYIPITAVLFLAVVAVAQYVAVYSSFGRCVYAVGGNEEAARLMGLPVARTKVSVYAVSGFCSALGGVVLTFYLSSGNHIEGVGMELDAIAAVVIGGTLLTGGVGSVFGTLVGVLTIGVILNAITTYEGGFSSGTTKVAIGGMLLLFVLLQRLLTGREMRAS